MKDTGNPFEFGSIVTEYLFALWCLIMGIIFLAFFLYDLVTQFDLILDNVGRNAIFDGLAQQAFGSGLGFYLFRSSWKSATKRRKRTQ